MKTVGIKNRYIAAVIAFLLAFSVLGVRAFNMQVLDRSAIEEANMTKQKTVSVSGIRGKILDAQGRVLAYDEKSFNIEFFRDISLERVEYTNSILKAINLIEENNGVIEPAFSVRKKTEGGFEFYWGNVSAETAKRREADWRKNFYFDDGETPDEIYTEMRKRYKLPEDLSDDQALKVLAIWQDSILSAYAAKPITVSRNVDYKLVAAMGNNSLSMPGMRISESTKRVYTSGTTGAHILGYMGRISENDVNEFVKLKGYSPDDYLGVSGVEKTMEDFLTGNGKLKSGKRTLEVDVRGNVIQELSYTPPENGDNVVLTIDINMQKKLEEALAENIEIIAENQREIYNDNKAKYEKLVEERGGRPVQFAKTGAAVVMDVNTGNVLALASYPSYDPNIFAKGITQTELDALINDPGKPLFNNAISSMGTPGSIFKMVSAVAGLSEGVIQVDEEIEDEGEYDKYVVDSSDNGPMCWIYKDYHVTHGMVDVVKAIEYSCNYFFFSVADRLGIEKLSRWAENFGLNSRTNIELPNEAKGQIGSPESLYDATRPIDQQRTGTAILVYRAIRDEIKKAVAASKKTITDEKVNEIVTEVFALIGEPRAKMLKEISSILNEKSGISKSKIETEVKFHVADYLNEITWTPTSTITTGIGQSITMLTPIAVARYISALVNGGFVYDAHVVSKVVDDSGAPVKEMVPTVFKNLNISPEYLDSVKHGMKDVVQGDDSSTARKHFQGFKYVDQMGGKTGTAQVSKINLENNSWFVSFAPFDKPEIAVVVYIPNGYSGGMSAHTTKQIIQYYLDNNSNRTVQTLPEENKPLT